MTAPLTLWETDEQSLLSEVTAIRTVASKFSTVKIRHRQDWNNLISSPEDIVMGVDFFAHFRAVKNAPGAHYSTADTAICVAFWDRQHLGECGFGDQIGHWNNVFKQIIKNDVN